MAKSTAPPVASNLRSTAWAVGTASVAVAYPSAGIPGAASASAAWHIAASEVAGQHIAGIHFAAAFPFVVVAWPSGPFVLVGGTGPALGQLEVA